MPLTCNELKTGTQKREREREATTETCDWSDNIKQKIFIKLIPSNY